MNRTFLPLRKFVFILLLTFLSITLSGPSLIAQSKQITFEHLTIDNGLSQGTIKGILQDAKGFMWFATQDGLNRFDGYNFRIFRHDDQDKNSISSNYIEAIDSDVNGDIWATTPEGLGKYNKESESFQNYPLPKSIINFLPTDARLYAIHCDKFYKKNIIWLGTERGVVRFDVENKLFEHFDLSKYTNEKEFVNTFAQEKNGDLWIGTNKNVALKLKRESNIIIKYSIENEGNNSTKGRMIKQIFADFAGDIWLATNKGLLKLNGSKNLFEKIIILGNENISRQSFISIEDDGDGKIYFGTQENLLVFNRRNSYLEKYKNKDNDPRTLTPGSITYLYINKDNIVWIGSNGNGIGFINPAKDNFNLFTKRNKYVPQVVMTDFYLSNKKVDVGEKLYGKTILPKSIVETDSIVLSYNENIFSFEYAALNYLLPMQNKYAYMLEGFDGSWIYCGNNRIANYTNIDPGTYVFRVKAANNDGFWNEAGISITVIINSPYWSTWWFKLFGILIFCSVMYGLYEFRLIAETKRRENLEDEVDQRTEELRIANEMLRRDALKLEETNNSKDRLFSIISHDLKNPFQSLLGYTEWLLEDYNTFSDDEKRKIINNICESSVNIYNLLVRLLEWSRLQTSRVNIEPVKIDLKNLVDSIIKILHVSLDKKQITVVNEIDYNISVYADENMLISIIQNLVTNAIKYSYENSVIIISLIANEEFVAVSVADSGVGISEKIIPKLFRTDSIHSTKGTNNELGTGFGLLLCKELVEKNGGTIWVESVLGKGSIFKFTIPRIKN